MYKFTGKDIQLTKGDSLSFSVSFTGRTLPAGAKALFSVKRRPKDTAAIIEKLVEISSNAATIHLLPTDTSDLQPGGYAWDIRVIIEDADVTEVRTPMNAAAFLLLEVVGDA